MRTITTIGFIHQQLPVAGTICVAEIKDSNTDNYKYRVRFLPEGFYVQATEEGYIRDAALETDKRGSKLPENAGRVLVLAVGEPCHVEVPNT